MPYLANSEDKLLIDLLCEYLENVSVISNETEFLFISITCYFDVKALKILASTVKRKLEKRGRKLSGFYVFVDVADWVKSRKSIKSIKKMLEKLLGTHKVNVYPISYSGQLFHAKSYCLVSSNKQHREGFLISTSGNLTMRGLGLKKHGNNIEICQVNKNRKILESFVKLVRELKTKKVNPVIEERQNTFLLAMRIFSRGSFYHKWEGSISGEVRFKLKLTDKGIAEIEQGTQQFGQYSISSKSISRDPLHLETIFNEKPKPFPKQFWGTYTVDTLLGRWAPVKIDSLINDVLRKSSQPYIDNINKLTHPKKINEIKDQLLNEVNKLKEDGYIDEDPERAVELWVNRIKRFRRNSELITARIFNYELIPDILDSANRKTIQKMVELFKKQVDMRTKIKGVKALLRDELNNPNRKIYNKKLESLAQKAIEKIQQQETRNG